MDEWLVCEMFGFFFFRGTFIPQKNIVMQMWSGMLVWNKNTASFPSGIWGFLKNISFYCLSFALTSWPVLELSTGIWLEEETGGGGRCFVNPVWCRQFQWPYLNIFAVWDQNQFRCHTAGFAGAGNWTCILYSRHTTTLTHLLGFSLSAGFQIQWYRCI